MDAEAVTVVAAFEAVEVATVADSSVRPISMEAHLRTRRSSLTVE